MANGPALRSVVWVQGCPLRCQGCFNPDFLEFTGGQEILVSELAARILTDLDTEGVTFSGGEPFSQAAALADLAELVHAAGKGVLIFTGFVYSALLKKTNADIQRLLATSDLLVAGPYQHDNPIHHALLASANQELIFLTERYRSLNFNRRRVEFHINRLGEVIITGFPRL